jgi:hypothetical protein
MMALGATTIAYDGSPVATPSVLWDLVDEHGQVLLNCLYMALRKPYFPQCYIPRLLAPLLTSAPRQLLSS